MSELLSPQKIIDSGLCIGCGSCAAQAPAGRVGFDAYGQLRPQGPAAWLAEASAGFTRTCPFSPGAANEDELAAPLFPAPAQRTPLLGSFEAAYVGHVAEGDFRAAGSSGGLVTWVATELLRQGLIDGVAHVAAVADPAAEGRFFCYRLARTEAEVRAGARSRYYPIELSEVLRAIRATPGRYAVVGLPCFIKAVQLLRREDPVLRERIAFTLGLFCGHLKSARFAESFAWQLGASPAEVTQVEYREKLPDRPANWYRAQLTLRDGRQLSRDWWHLADGDWGAGFYMNSACNYCDDVVAETADIAFGDAWVEPYASDGRGTNVVITRSRPVQALLARAIAEGRLALTPVGAAFVEQTQAAGFRQRREGLAYRLTWARRGVRPRKRVAPSAALPRRRRLIYRLRYFIAAASHRMFWVARRLGWPALFLGWARAALAVYHGLAYHQGKLREMWTRFRGLG